MGCSCKEKCPNGEYMVKVYTYPKSDLEECFKLPYSVENYYKLVNSIDSRDKNQTFSRGDYCPINVITRKALFLAKSKRISIKDCSEGDMLMLVDGCSVGVTESGRGSSYYKGGHTVVKVGSEVNDLEYVNKEGYFSKPFISISVSGSTFYGISGGAYNTNGMMFHGFSENTVLYVTDMSDGKPGYLSKKCYIRLEDYYNIMKEVIVGLKDDYGLRI